MNERIRELDYDQLANEVFLEWEVTALRDAMAIVFKRHNLLSEPAAVEGHSYHYTPEQPSASSGDKECVCGMINSFIRTRCAGCGQVLRPNQQPPAKSAGEQP